MVGELIASQAFGTRCQRVGRMIRGRFDWRRGRGWFRIWILLTLAWYAVTLFLLFQEARGGQTVSLIEATESGVFQSQKERDAFIKNKSIKSESTCVPGTLRATVRTQRWVGRPGYQSQLQAWQRKETRWNYSKRMPGDSTFDRIVVSMLDREEPGWRNKLVERPWDAEFIVGSLTCTSAEHRLALFLGLLASLATPFLVILALYLGFLSWRGFAKTGALTGNWVMEGFQAAPPEAELGSGRRTSTFGVEFWPGLKGVLYVVAGVSATIWVVYSSSSGVARSTTIQTLTQAVLVGAAVLVYVAVRKSNTGSSKTDDD